MSTTLAKPETVERSWFVVDACGQTLGRLSTRIATVLRGKHKVDFTPHVDCGDYVIVVNADKVVFTGTKWDKKVYTWYTGYPGLKSETARERLQRRPELILQLAVRRMLPKNRLGRKLLKKLKIYAGPDHPHQAQQPEPLELTAT